MKKYKSFYVNDACTVKFNFKYRLWFDLKKILLEDEDINKL